MFIIEHAQAIDASIIFQRVNSPWVWEESPGDSIGWQLVRGGALEPSHGLGFALAVVHVVGIVAHVLLCGVSEATLARSLISHTVGALEAWKMTESNH